MRRFLYTMVAGLLVFSGQPAALRPGSAADTFIYRVYGEQMATLLSARGVPREEIDD